MGIVQHQPFNDEHEYNFSPSSSLQEGIWGGVGEERNLITERVQPGYVNCRPQGRLPGCLFEFDKPDTQCRTERMGEGGGGLGFTAIGELFYLPLLF